MFRVIAALLCLSSVFPLIAQESRATLTGRVTDSSAAAVVGARVKATNLQTGVTVTATSNETGAFLLPFLLPGKYRFTAEATGFKMWSQNELDLRVNDSVALDVRLEVGGQTETVEVTAGTPLLETADASLGNVIDERRLQELPQRGGNPLELERLNPGVVNLTTLRIMKPSSPDGTSSISVNGSGNFGTQYTSTERPTRPTIAAAAMPAWRIFHHRWR